jgi:hypothetical protein
MKLVLLLLILSLHLAAQSAGILRGVITDQSGAPIPGTTITAARDEGQPLTTKSRDDGSYVLGGLQPGTYSVEAASPGLAQRDPATVRIATGTSVLNIQMSLTLERQQITVNESISPVVSTDPDQSASAQVMRSDDLDAISDDPDDLMADLLALAGPSAGPNGGQIFIDGFTAGDGALPGKDAIREVRINQNPFSPEFDTLGTGHIEILTKPGTDKLRGEVFFTYGNGIFNSRNPYAAQKAPFDLKDFGGSLSGRFSSKGSFFLNFDKRNIDNGEVVNAVTLNPATLTIISPFTQVTVSPLRRFYVGARADYQLTAKNTLMVRYEPNLNTSENGGVGNFTLPSQAYRSSLMEHSLQATETAAIGNSVINETRFQFRHQNSSQTPDSTDPSISVANSFNAGGAGAGLHDYIHHHYEVQNYTTHIRGTHTLRYGARLRAVSIKDTSEQNFNGIYIFGGAYAPVLDAQNQPVAPGVVCNPQAAPATGCATVSSIEQYRRTLLFQQMGLSAQAIRALGGEANQFSINAGNPVVFVGGADIGAFAGDDWKLKPNLTLSLGVRYETQENIRDRSDIAPRLAFAWAPGASAKNSAPRTVIRGGFGMFYDRFSEQNVLIAQRYDGTNQQQFIVIDPNTYPAIPSSSALQLSPQSLHTIGGSLRTPYLIQSSIGVERQLPQKTTVAVTYTNSHGLHELLSRNINAPLPGTYTGVPGSGVYPFPAQGPIYEMESAGLYNQNQLAVNVNARPNTKISLFGSYSLNYVRSNTDGLNTFPANQYSMAGEYGPAGNDVRHRGSLGGSITTKLGLQWNPFIIVQSGAPFNIVTSQDIYGDTLLTARPAFAASPSQAGAITTPFGVFDPNPSAVEKIVPRNYGRGPGIVTVNLRLARTFRFGEPRSGKTDRPYALILSISARNLVNHVNPGPIIGNINSPLFGRSNQIASGSGAYADGANNRRLELQARFSF